MGWNKPWPALLLITFTLLGCKQAPTNLSAYKNWFASTENGYVKTRQVGQLEYKVMYTPAEYLVSNNLSDQQVYTQDALEAQLAAYSTGRNFILQVGFNTPEPAAGEALIAAQAASYEQYAERIQNLAFKLKERAKLVAGGDTCAPTIYHYERGFELAKRQTFLFSFPAPTASSEFTFIFDDPLFETGLNKFHFGALAPIPPLPINYQ